MNTVYSTTNRQKKKYAAQKSGTPPESPAVYRFCILSSGLPGKAIVLFLCQIHPCFGRFDEDFHVDAARAVSRCTHGHRVTGLVHLLHQLVDERAHLFGALVHRKGHELIAAHTVAVLFAEDVPHLGCHGLEHLVACRVAPGVVQLMQAVHVQINTAQRAAAVHRVVVHPTSIPETESEQENIENERKNLNKLDQEFLDKVTAIIEENLCMEKMDVAFIADKMCMSHSTLYRKIKGLTEMTVNEYVRKIKMKKGMELINEGKYSLAEISDLTGFSSVAYFRQCFKDEYGMAPTEYLKRKQN